MHTPEKTPTVENKGEERAESIGTFAAMEAWLRKYKFAAALTGGLALAVYDHAPVAIAAEIPPGASWEEGIGILKDLTYHGHEEHAGIYITTTEGAFWGDIKIINATATSLKREFLDQYIKRLEGEKALAGTVTKFCSLHTHPLEGFAFGKSPTLNQEAIGDIRDGKRHPPFELPSPTDFDGYSAQRDRFKNMYKDDPSKMPEYISGAVTAFGIIYYGGNNISASEKKHYYEYITKRYGEGSHPLSEYASFARLINNATHKGEIASPELSAYALEALRNAGYSVRIVPYEELPNEPLCAGVNYQSRKSQTETK